MQDKLLSGKTVYLICLCSLAIGLLMSFDVVDG
jgi:hypothetical protein